MGEAYAALGSVNLWFEWNWPEAEANIKRAIELNPSNPNIHILYAAYLIIRGQTDLAVNHLKQAVQLDPVSLLTTGLSAELYLTAGLYDDAIALSKRMLELEPKSSAGHWFLINAYRAKAMHEEARNLALKRMTETGANQESIALLKQGDAREGFDRLERWQFERMKESLSKGEKNNAAWVAQAFARKGEKDLAFEWLEKAYADRLPSLVFINIGSDWEPLRVDARITDFLQRMRLRP
jgi:tetratricopeptide (TPR) repeat protein